ncbi:MAG: hypothetical protein ACO3YQ_08405, partial [Flavobacteriales bacterium]
PPIRKGGNVRVEVEIEALLPEPAESFLGWPHVQRFCAGPFEQGTVPLQGPVDLVQHRVRDQQLPVVAQATCIVAKPLVAAAVGQMCSAVGAGSGGSEE